MQFDLYGSTRSDIDALKVEIEEVLGIELVPRSSGYLGDYFSCGEIGGEEFSLQRNEEGFGDELEALELDFPECALLLYVSRSPRGDWIRDALRQLPTLRFLRREDL